MTSIRRNLRALRDAHQARSRLIHLDPISPETVTEYAKQIRRIADAGDASPIVRWLYRPNTAAQLREEAELLDPTRSTQ